RERRHTRLAAVVVEFGQDGGIDQGLVDALLGPNGGVGPPNGRARTGIGCTDERQAGEGSGGKEFHGARDHFRTPVRTTTSRGISRDCARNPGISGAGLRRHAAQALTGRLGWVLLQPEYWSGA